MLIQVHLEVHVSQEAEAAVAALEFYGLVKLGYRNDIKLFENLMVRTLALLESMTEGVNIKQMPRLRRHHNIVPVRIHEAIRTHHLLILGHLLLT